MSFEKEQVIADALAAPDAIKAVTNQLQVLLADLRVELAEVRRGGQWSEQEASRREAAIRAAYEPRVRALREQVAGQVAAVDAVPRTVFAEAFGSVEEKTLAEMQLQRAWQRVQRSLDAGVAPQKIARDAVKAGDTDTIRALRQELPGHMQATGQPEELAGGVLKIIETHAVSMLPEREQEALRAAAAARDAKAVADINLGAVESEVTTGKRATFFATSKNGPVLDVSRIGVAA